MYACVCRAVWIHCPQFGSGCNRGAGSKLSASSGTGRYLATNLGSCCGTFTQVLSQTITAVLTGELDHVSLWMDACQPAGDLIIQITSVDANGVPQVGNVLGSVSVAPGAISTTGGCSSWSPVYSW